MTQKSFQELSDINQARSLAWHKGTEWSLSDWGVAFGGEAGEVLDAIKKINRFRDGLQHDTKTEAELTQDLADEIGDAYAYLDLLASHAGLSVYKCFTDKFNKVSEKYGFEQRV